jgi:hypothetical protein
MVDKLMLKILWHKKFQTIILMSLTTHHSQTPKFGAVRAKTGHFSDVSGCLQLVKVNKEFTADFLQFVGSFRSFGPKAGLLACF